MRLNLLWLGLIVLTAAACGGQEAADPAPSGGLNGLPAPREISTGDSVLRAAPGSRNYVTSTAVWVALETGVGVTQDNPEFNLHFAASSAEQLTYVFFGIAGLEPAEATLAQVSLVTDWEGGTPAGEQQGFYVGMPDFDRNVWIWRGPIKTSSDIVDFSLESITANPDFFNLSDMALVNYSDQAAVLRFVNYSTTQPGDSAGDESLYFISHADGGFSIQRAELADLDHPQPVLTAEAGVELANLFVRDGADEDLLIFDRRAAGGLWEVWQAQLDGSDAQLRYSGAEDVSFAGLNEDSSREFILRGSYPEGSIARIDCANATPDIESPLPGAAIAGRWFGDFGYDVALMLPGFDEENFPTIFAYYKSVQFDSEHYVPLLYLPSGSSTQDPFYARWANGQFGVDKVFLYSAKMEGEANFNLRLNSLGTAALQNNRIFTAAAGGADLRFPVLSADNKYLSYLACAPGMAEGELYVQSSFLREQDLTAAIASNVVGRAAWFDPTPVVLAE